MISSNKFWFQRFGKCKIRSVLVRQIVNKKTEVVISWTKNQENLYSVFQQFKSVHGHCNVNSNFQFLPGNGSWPGHDKAFRLGQLFSNIRNLNHNKVIKPALVELGFDVEPDIKYEDMRDALVKYKELKRHAQVPCDFRVPPTDNRYPENTRGLHLGFAVHTAQVNGCYEQHHEELKQLGVNFDIKSPGSVKSSVIHDATVAFKSIHGHLDVPVRFIVPPVPVYDEATWGLQLGLALCHIRVDRLHCDRKEDFLALGLNETVRSPSDFEVIYSALKAYKLIHGNLLVPRSFIVPPNDTKFPPETWGMNLGVKLYSVRNSGCFSEHRVKLEELGVNFEVEKVQQWDFLAQIFPALEAYKSVHGDLLVPKSFVVPQDDANYPSDTWGINLGSNVHHIRCSGAHIQYKERLTALGFVYESVFDVQFAKIYSALEAYKAIHGDLLVREKFVVPQGDVRFPSETWGMKLGFNVQNIRNRSDYFEHRIKLDELGFVFKKNKKVVEIV
jgi:hypothetical protein